jgi:hypothetical protein
VIIITRNRKYSDKCHILIARLSWREESDVTVIRRDCDVQWRLLHPAKIAGFVMTMSIECVIVLERRVYRKKKRRGEGDLRNGLLHPAKVAGFEITKKV